MKMSQVMKNILGLMALSLCSLTVIAAASTQPPMHVIYPKFESSLDQRNIDLVEILTLALDKTTAQYGPYELHPAKDVMTERRAAKELIDNTGVLTVIWSSTSTEKETQMLPIRIPLRKGLMGYRINLTHKNNLEKIHASNNSKQLTDMVVGQGLGWGDVAVYQANGFKVATSPLYESIFKMLDKQRFDLFPRGINEVFNEYALHKELQPDLTIEPEIGFYYPWPYYFFCNQDNPQLATRLESGLKQMIDDGSFHQLFLKYNQESIHKAGLSERRLYILDNPTLPKETPLHDRRLWYFPE